MAGDRTKAATFSCCGVWIFRVIYIVFGASEPWRWRGTKSQSSRALLDLLNSRVDFCWFLSFLRCSIYTMYISSSPKIKNCVYVRKCWNITETLHPSIHEFHVVLPALTPFTWTINQKSFKKNWNSSLTVRSFVVGLFLERLSIFNGFCTSKYNCIMFDFDGWSGCTFVFVFMVLFLSECALNERIKKLAREDEGEVQHKSPKNQFQFFHVLCFCFLWFLLVVSFFACLHTHYYSFPCSTRQQWTLRIARA